MEKIIHISNFNLIRLKGCFQLGMPFKISNGLIRNGYAVYNYPDRDLCRLFGWNHTNFWGKRKLNKHLITYCKAIEPDVLFIGHANLIDVETLLNLKSIFPRLKILQWTCDWVVPGYAGRNISFLKRNMDAVDAFFITTGDKKMLSQFKTENNIVAFLPNIADAALETGRGFNQVELPYDIMLCAHAGTRQFCGEMTVLSDIIEESISKIDGLRWQLAGFNGKPSLDGFSYIRALHQSAMGFNISNVNDVYLYSSDRMVHFMANGQLVFLDERTGFQDIFNDREVVYYGDRQEFFDKIAYYKKYPEQRMKIAKAAYQRVHSEFSNVKITQYMMDILLRRRQIVDKPWKIVLQ